MEPEARQRTWAARLGRAVLGPGHQPRLTITHCLHSAAEACFTISLAGSIFFNVSPDAARPRVLLFLALALAPFVVMTPLIGPVIDRLRGGLASTMIATFVVRAVLVLLAAANLRTLLLFPLVFGVLVAAKAYTVSRNALVPSIAADEHDLVDFNARLSRTATIVGAAAAGLAIAVYAWGSAVAALSLAAALYTIGAAAAWRVRAVAGPIERVDIDAVVELVQPDVGEALRDMMALRAAVGFAVFQFGFSLRAEAAPPWVLGLALAAHAFGSFAGTIVSPLLRRRMTERTMFTVALVVPAIAMGACGVALSDATLVAAMLALGLGASIGRRAFDTTIQRQAPNARRGQVYAGLETRLELAWVSAACLAVALRIATWVGILALAAFLAGVTIAHLRRYSGLGLVRPIAAVPLPDRLLLRAETLTHHGFHDEATLLARLARSADPDDVAHATGTDALGEIERVRAELTVRRRDHLAHLVGRSPEPTVGPAPSTPDGDGSAAS